ncbi:hypothetical protein HK101_004482 [Irineochytrium annulatum]|nr:hypothetical protein HK101_004482 [Irineochytrium annulatum]
MQLSDVASDASVEVLKAMACGVELLAAMKGYQVDISPIQHRGGPALEKEPAIIPLKIHIGIGVGTMYRVHLGEPEPAAALDHTQIPRRKFFVAGPAVVMAGEMEGLAGSGQMAAPATTKTLLNKMLGDAVTFRTTSDGSIVVSEKDDLNVVIEMLKAAHALCEPNRARIGADTEGVIIACPKFMSHDFLRVLSYVDESLAFHLLHSDAAFSHREVRNPDYTEKVEAGYVESNNAIDQLRNVTVVFIRFTGLSVAHMNDSQTLQLTQKLFMTIVGVLRRSKGCLRQFACDDKAATALIVFGLSGLAHERGEELAALRAAWEIRLKLLQLVGTDFGIGVASGVV